MGPFAYYMSSLNPTAQVFVIASWRKYGIDSVRDQVALDMMEWAKDTADMGRARACFQSIDWKDVEAYLERQAAAAPADKMEVILAALPEVEHLGVHAKQLLTQAEA